MLGQRHERRELRSNIPALRQRHELRSAHHELAGAPRVRPLRERSVKSGTSQAGADPERPTA